MMIVILYQNIIEMSVILKVGVQYTGTSRVRDFTLPDFSCAINFDMSYLRHFVPFPFGQKVYVTISFLHIYFQGLWHQNDSSPCDRICRHVEIYMGPFKSKDYPTKPNRVTT